MNEEKTLSSHQVLFSDGQLGVLLSSHALGILLPLQDDINVTSDQLRDGITLSGLDRVVGISIVTKIEGQAI